MDRRAGQCPKVESSYQDVEQALLSGLGQGKPNDLDHWSVMSTAEPAGKSKSLLRNFLTCVACSQPMKIERGDPDAEGRVVVQYRCGSCGHIELIGFR
jgi:hypothetical protein